MENLLVPGIQIDKLGMKKIFKSGPKSEPCCTPGSKLNQLTCEIVDVS